MAVLIGLPSYDNSINTLGMAALMNEARLSEVPPFLTVTGSLSLASANFNTLWTTALNNRADFSHFLMMHSDVYPVREGWLKTLVDEMAAVGADVLSVIMPIKDEKGLTSTALTPRPDSGLGRSRPKRRRLVMSELENLPPTFEARAVDRLFGWNSADPCLLVNTGLMLVDLRKPWTEKIWFTVRDATYKDDDGQWAVDVEPEDWNFSRRAHVMGARVYATRVVSAVHVGRMNFPNDSIWGTWERDYKADNQ